MGLATQVEATPGLQPVTAGVSRGCEAVPWLAGPVAADLLAGLFTGDGPPDLGGLAAIAAGYGLEVDPASVPVLAERHGPVLE